MRSAGRQGFSTHKLFKQLDRFSIPGNVFDCSLMIFGQKRRRLVRRKLFVFAEEFRVSIGFAKGFFQSLYPVLGCSGGKNEGGTGHPKRALQFEPLCALYPTWQSSRFPEDG